jgi:hypothetical protein
MKASSGAKAALAATTAACLTLAAALADDAARLTGIPVDESAGYLKPIELPNSLVLLPPPPSLSSPSEAAFIETESPETALLVLVCLMVIQFFIGSYLEPVFSGWALAISPSVVMFSVLLWTFIWGILGAFLGVPLAIATLTLCEKFPATRWISEIFSGESPKETGPARLST